MMPENLVLSARERSILATVCDAFHPHLAVEPGDDAALFAIAASDLGVAQVAEQAIALLAPAEQSQLRLLLKLLDNPIAAGAIAGIPRGVRAMSPRQRERLLRALATGAVPDLRSGFQALKRLSSFLFYSLSDRGRSPVLSALGYEPSSLPRADVPRLALTSITKDERIDADVCIVGSGAGGSVVAAALAAKGLRVVVLEAGPGLQADEFEQRELDGMQDLYYQSGLSSTRDLGVAILAGHCLGGGTTVNWQTCLRTPDDVRDEWAERSGCGLFAGERFTRALDEAWTRVGASTDESFVNANNAPLRRGCEALGYSWSTIARNARGCDQTQCGYCTFGCRIGGKQSTAVTYLLDAQQRGDCTIIANCRVQSVLAPPARGVEGVDATVRVPDGREATLHVRAPKVVVAAGGIESPALLLRSLVELPELGRNLYLHPTTAVAGVYADRVESWRGPPQTIVCDHFANIDGRGYGFRLETAPAHPGLLALALPWTSAVQHRRTMQRAPHASAIIALCRDAVGGRVRVRGDKTTAIDYVPGAAERRRIAKGIEAASRVHLAAGASAVHTLQTSGLSFTRSPTTTSADVDAFCRQVADARVHGNRSLIASAHQMGTCRMGRDPRTAVCDERGQVFGVRGLFVADASLFPASSGVNPMITVMALAACVADGIDR